MAIDLSALLAAVRRILADPAAPFQETGDAALDQALIALAMGRLQGTELPYWMLTRTEPEGQIGRQ